MAARLVVAGLLASIVLVAGHLALALPDAGSPEARRALLLLDLALAAPYGAALALLAPSAAGLRSRAFALAGGTAGVAFALLGPVIALVVLFAGFSTSTRELQSIGVAALFVPVQLALAVAAVRAHRALPAAEKRPGAWGVGVALPLAYGLLLAAGVRFEGWHARSGERAQRDAHAALHAVRECAWRWADTHPERGYPPDLAALGPGGAGCLDASLAAGGAGGHRVVYAPGVPDATGRVGTFALCVHPTRDVRGGAKAWAGNETGEYGVHATAAAAGVRACADTWGAGLPLLKHCLLRHAAASGAGHPADRDALLRTLDDCTGRATATAAGEDRFELAGALFLYRPSPPDAAGVVRGFELSTAEGDVGRLLDETGRIHVAMGREATRADPTAEEGQEVACRRGEAAACLEAGRAFVNGWGVRPDPARGGSLLVAACEAGLGRACLDAASLYAWKPELGMAREAVARLERRACDLGETQGCAAVWDPAAMPASATP